jgi:proteasome lid subunit RPN8/RPN11
MLSNTLKSQIKEYSNCFVPNESCGLLVSSHNSKLLANNDKNNLTFFPCKNTSEEPTKHFLLDQRDYLKASKRGEIKALIHSQPHSDFSELDKLNAVGHSIYSIVYCWLNDEFFYLDPQNLEINKYIGREFEIGKSDCFTLLREYYKNELNIQINDYPHKDGWYEENPRIIIENYQKEGFRVVELENIQKHDILISAFTSEYPMHFAINLGGNQILHHERNKFSNIEFLSDSYIRKIKMIVRHKNL